MIPDTLRIHYILPNSYSNGPGARWVLWVQGCSLNCRGCFNPDTHPSDDGRSVAVGELFDNIMATRGLIEGVTVLGGEPLQQSEVVLSLLKKIRSKTDLSVLLFTGYTWDEVCSMPFADELAACVDVLFAGRYDESRRVAHGLVGSSNKTIHCFTDRYSLSDLDTVPECEAIIGEGGRLILSGIDPLDW